ncbi:nudix hydrolase 9 isoform X2 [Phalaenopsis equestris]|uniref:nudix hydrolase 9 isoform X2 n=1 Tax=Phalaenopsis equestris TaxID=78828 RepID=UPI0009E27A11|nr:nudix hydrolase 9 isoform X2 [Phalaenopsis equestris]
MSKAGNEQKPVMDPGSAFTLLLSCPGGLPRSRVYVDFGVSYDRIPHPDADLEESINEIWTCQVEKKPSLYNGKKFRYGGYTLHHAEGGNKSSLCLQLGLTDYRTFVGTNLSPLWEDFLVSSEEVGVSSHQTNKISTDHEVLNGKISQEMFEGIIREVVEEIGVPAESLTDPIFIGISRRNLNVRPTAFFFINCSLGSHEIQQLYSRAQDGYESIQLYDVSMEELLKMSERMPGCHRGGFALYEQMMKASQGDL